MSLGLFHRTIARSESPLRSFGPAALLPIALIIGFAASAHAAFPPAREGLADVLVRPNDARFVAAPWTREPEVVAFYFGADWCTPCRAFVPQLREVYAALRAHGADTEVVFVSLDRSEREMLRYMQRQRMPWPAVDRRRLASLPGIRRLEGKGPPNLVLMDRTGRVLASAWEGDEYLGPAKVLAVWLEYFSQGPVRVPADPDRNPG